MKALVGAVLPSVVLCCTAPLSAQPVMPSPLLGVWAVDVSNLPMPPEQRPRSVTFTFSDAGGGKWTSNVEIVAADGTATRGSATFPRDGTPAPVTDSPEADTIAVTTPQPDVLIMALSKNGVPGSTRILTVAPDGNSYTETASYFGRDGKPVMRTNRFSRVR